MTIIEDKKKSALGAKGHFDYEKLIYQIEGFLPSTYEEGVEEIRFTYDIAGMKTASEIRTEEKEKQYQFLSILANCHILLRLIKSLLRKKIYTMMQTFCHILEKETCITKGKRQSQVHS